MLNRLFATLFLLMAILTGALFVGWVVRHDFQRMFLTIALCFMFCAFTVNEIIAAKK